MYYIGIDLGGTNIAAGVVDENCNIIAESSVPTGAAREYKEIIADMAGAAKKAISEAGLTEADIQSIGIGSPGTVDNKKGVIVYSNNINFRNVPMREEMQKHFDLPVYMGNDADVAAFGEYVACREDVPYFIAITLGTGVGGGIIIDGKIYNGFNCAGAELGHITLIKDGEPCSCGRLGCWEAYASVTALIRQTRLAAARYPDSMVYKLMEGNLAKASGKTAFVAAKAGDEVGQMIVDQYTASVAEGIASIINIFQPNILVIGGGISKEGDYLLDPVKQIVAKGRYSRDIAQTQLRIAKLGNAAGIVGAALLGTEGK